MKKNLASRNKARFLIILLLLQTYPVVQAESQQDPSGRSFIFTPGGLKPKTAEEFISTNPNLQQLVKVQIQGQVRTPGVFYLPKDTSLSEAIALAGGGNDRSSETFRLIRNGQSSYIPIYGAGLMQKIAPNDIIIVTKSLRSDLPLVFSTLSAALTLATLVILIRKN
jgi:hypothetical protein